MTPNDALDLFRLAMWTTGVASAPALIAAMVVGCTIAMLQTVTQVQEVTLSFVPKIVAVLLTLVATSVLIGSSLNTLTEECYGRIAYSLSR